MALRKLLILRKLRSSCLEGRTALIPPIIDFLPTSESGVQGAAGIRCRLPPVQARVGLGTRFRGHDEKGLE